MRDDRVFHISQSDWLERYNKQGPVFRSPYFFHLELIVSQVMLELTKVKAWDKSGPEEVIEQAQVRLRENGWDDVRPALATTIRLAAPSTSFCLSPIPISL